MVVVDFALLGIVLLLSGYSCAGIFILVGDLCGVLGFYLTL